MLSEGQALWIARQHFNEADADWNVLGALAADGEITPQTFDALTDYHELTKPPHGCACQVPRISCEIGELREYVRRVLAAGA